jgi:hypothetical protein
VSEEKKEEATKSENGLVAAVTAQAKSFQDGIGAVRQRTDIAAKTVASLGTAGVSAVGLAKFADIFPFEGPDWAVIAVLAGFLAMVVSVAGLTARLWRTQQPLVIRSDPELMTDELSDRKHRYSGRTERELVEDVFDDMTVLNGVVSLRAYEARGRRLRRVARRFEAEPAKKLTEEADQIRAEVGATQIRAAHAVIRRRAWKAVRGFWSLIFFLVFLGGLAGVAIGADRLEAERTAQDRLEAERTSEIGFYKSCAEAANTGVRRRDLPEDCPAVKSPPDAPGEGQGSSGASE